MTKLYRIVSYVLDLAGSAPTKKDVEDQLKSNKYPEFLRLIDVRETAIEDYDDNHRLNKTAATQDDFDAYFTEIGAEKGDPWLKQEHQRVRSIMLQQIQKNYRLENELLDLKEEIKKLNKVKEFISSVKDLTK